MSWWGTILHMIRYMYVGYVCYSIYMYVGYVCYSVFTEKSHISLLHLAEKQHERCIIMIVQIIDYMYCPTPEKFP